jgi:hypothetical protein
MAIRVLQLAGPVIIGGMFVVGWLFGLYVLFKTRNWDALTRPLPLAICILVLVQVALTTIGSGALQSAISIVGISVLLVGTALPALSGVTLWIGRQSPARLWAAEQVIRGKILIRGVAASLMDGVSVGVVVAAVGVLADWAALSLPGFVPSIGREIDAVEAGIGSVIGETIGGSSFIALGIALAVEVLDRARLNAAVSTLIVAAGAALVAASNQTAFLPGLTLITGMGAGAALAVWLYRSRGFLAIWIAAVVAGLVTDAMAVRSLEDPTLLQLSNGVLTIVVLLAAAGGWGLFRTRVPAPQPAR